MILQIDPKYLKVMSPERLAEQSAAMDKLSKASFI
jgi:hypothetical protein